MSTFGWPWLSNPTFIIPRPSIGSIMVDPLVGYAEEPTDLESSWRAYTQNDSFTPKVWSDAYAAAFAQAAQLELVTFDRGFRRYKQTRCTILEP